MSLSKTYKDKGQPSQSGYQSSGVEPVLLVPTQSVLAGSEMVGDIVTLSLQPCEACQRTEGAAVTDAKWFCRECEELLCDECKTFHKKFKMSAGHNVVSLHVPCSLCTTKSITSTGIYYCRECEDFLCTECKSWHQQFKVMKDHPLIKSQEKIKESDQTQTKGPSTSVQQIKDDTKRSVAPSKKPSSSKNVSLANKVHYDGERNVRSADDEMVPVITSSIFLSDSSLLLVDTGNRKLKYFDSKFKLIQVQRFRIHPRRVAVNEINELVVTTAAFSIIKLSVGDTIRKKGIIQVSFDCWGIDFIDRDRLAVAGNKNPGIFCVYTMDGTVLSTTIAKMGSNVFCFPYYVTVDKKRQRAYVSDHDNDTVVALDIRRDNNVFFRYTKRGLNPCGIGLADDCVIIIAECFIWGSVHQISEEGVYNKVLLSQKKCMNYPRTISFTPSGDGFIVGGGNQGSDTGGKIRVYSLT